MFDNIVGNNEMKAYLKDSIQSNNISHSYMFCGISGIGKKLFAQEFAKKIMCIEENDEQERCDSCIKFNANSNPDFTLIEPEGTSIKINQIRKMQEDIAKKPIISHKKVIVINNADLMSEESQNCLLKTLEEPPEYAIIILIVSNENKMLATIKSRCVILKFKKIKNEEIKKYIPDLTDEQVELLEGSFEGKDSIQEKFADYQQMVNVVNIIKAGNIVETFNNAEILYNKKENIKELLNYMNVILYKYGLYEAIDVVEKTKTKLQYNNNYEMCIDYLLLNCIKSI